MRLKKLEIFGFKSFADKIEILFDSGITAIVGPNGSGKSNIGDAVRWVLGEQNARVLRGARMEDIIFNGTAKRKALNFCEVNLTIDNAEGLLSVPYTEVTVTRRVFRSGESEYYINKQTCRLKDVVDLFRDTGVGKEGYSIVGQGEIIEIINSKPEDRRGAFHESAGIMKYRVRKEEAERRLGNTRANLQRIGDIAAEVTAQLEPLRVQSENAREYLTLSEELKDLEINQYLIQYDKAKARLEGLQQQITQTAAELEAGSAEVAELEAELARHTAAQDELDERSAAIRAEITALTAEEHQAEGSRNLAAERIANLRRDMERLKTEAEGHRERVGNLHAEHARLGESLAAQEADLQARRAQADALEQELAATGAHLRQEEEQAEERKTEVMRSLNRIGDIKSSLSRLSALEEGIRNRLGQMEGSAEKLERELSLVRDAAADIDETLHAQEAQLAADRAESEKTNQLVLELAGRKRDIDERFGRGRERLQATATRINMLTAMKRDYEGYNESVKRLLVDCRNDSELRDRVEGVVGELIEVPSQLVRAVEMVLGPAMQNIVTPTEEDAKALINHLRRQNYGRATFLPVTTVRGRGLNGQETAILRMNGCVGLASQLVKFDARYRDIVENLLGRTVIADSMDSAIAMARACHHSVRIATLQGDIMNPGGSMTGGSVHSRYTSLLGRSAELEEMTALRGRIAAELEDLQKQAADVAAQGAAAAEEQTQRSRAVHELELTLTRERERRDKAAQTEERVAASLQTLVEERTQLEDNLRDITAERAVIESSQGGEEQSNQSAREEILRIQMSINARREAYAALQEELGALRVSLAGAERSQANAHSERHRLEREAERAEAQAQDCAGQAARAEQQLQVEVQTLEQSAAHHADRSDRRAEAEGRLQATEDARAELRTVRHSAERRLSALRATQDERREQQSKLQAQQARGEADLEGLQNRIWDNYELTYAMALKLRRDDFETAGAAKRIGEIRERIRAMGTVNVNAIEDYIALKDRHEDYERQTADLQRAEQDLVRIIDELNEKMEKRFREQFELLNRYFGETFVQMFGGGMARLVLKDEADLLNSGIDIVAQPPGKQLVLLSLLSGGEKSLTAISLLFAMLRLNPSPFCLLDEIEAALDDVNVKRFADFLNDYTRKTQFVVVTHRKGTMEASNAIYGVTMEEKGISRLVSMKMADYIEEPEASHG